MRTVALVSFRDWSRLDLLKQQLALSVIKEDLRRWVKQKVAELYPDAAVVLDQQGNAGDLVVKVELERGEFPNGNLGEFIRTFLANCQEPQLLGFELTTEIGGISATDVVGGGLDQLYGTGPVTVRARKEF